MRKFLCSLLLLILLGIAVVPSHAQGGHLPLPPPPGPGHVQGGGF